MKKQQQKLRHYFKAAKILNLQKRKTSVIIQESNIWYVHLQVNMPSPFICLSPPPPPSAQTPFLPQPHPPSPPPLPYLPTYGKHHHLAIQFGFFLQILTYSYSHKFTQLIWPAPYNHTSNDWFTVSPTSKRFSSLMHEHTSQTQHANKNHGWNGTQSVEEKKKKKRKIGSKCNAADKTRNKSITLSLSIVESLSHRGASLWWQELVVRLFRLVVHRQPQSIIFRITLVGVAADVGTNSLVITSENLTNCSLVITSE